MCVYMWCVIFEGGQEDLTEKRPLNKHPKYTEKRMSLVIKGEGKGKCKGLEASVCQRT